MYRQNKWCPMHLQLIHFALSAVLNQKLFSLYFLVYIMHNKENLSEYDSINYICFMDSRSKKIHFHSHNDDKFFNTLKTNIHIL